MWPERAGEANYPECADLDKLYDRIIAELQDPFKDRCWR